MRYIMTSQRKSCHVILILLQLAPALSSETPTSSTNDPTSLGSVVTFNSMRAVLVTEYGAKNKNVATRENFIF